MMSLLSIPTSQVPYSSSSSSSSSCFGRPWLITSSGKARKLPAVQSNIKSNKVSIVCLRGAANAASTTSTAKPTETESIPVIGRHSFPPGFTFGAASSAFQIEGAWNEGGKGPSIWDTFCHENPDKIKDGSNADVAVDSYHRYKDDVKLLKDMNMDSYRFSIAWTRILPTGSLKGGKNQEGIDYYHNLIDELIANGIQPCVTLFHWDVPQGLEDEYGGFRSKRIVDDFKDYCDICFQEYGNKVKYWITLNEPWSFATLGYSLGHHAPHRCSEILKYGCPVGDSLVEPYIVSHNLILAHGKAYRLFKEKYQIKYGGEIGITLNSLWYPPYDDVHRDHEGSKRLLDFMLGWYMDPLVHGDYPFTMKSLVRERLPTFSKEESEMITESFDFIGLNYYSGMYAQGYQFSIDKPLMVSVHDAYAEQLYKKDGVPIGPGNGSWLYEYPEGLKHLLHYIRNRYFNPRIYITENGYSYLDVDGSMTKEEAIADPTRTDYHERHLAIISEAIRSGANVKGYYAWSLLDNFEWEKGYTERFGLCYVDYNTLERYPKDSAKWFSRILKK